MFHANLTTYFLNNFLPENLFFGLKKKIYIYNCYFDSRIFSANCTIRIAFSQRYRPCLSCQPIQHPHFRRKWSWNMRIKSYSLICSATIQSCSNFDDFQSLHRADQSDNRPYHSTLRAVGHQLRIRRNRKQAAVTWTVLNRKTITIEVFFSFVWKEKRTRFSNKVQITHSLIMNE